MEEVSREKRRLLFLDEVNFTKLSLPKRDWSEKHSNLAVEQSDVYQGYRSVLACMTEGRGIELLEIQDHAFDSTDFMKYLKSMRRKYKTEPLALFMDQLAVHRHKDVKPLYEQLNIRPVFNVGYSPEFNPIESCFSVCKFHFCKSRLNRIVNRKNFDFDQTIEDSFRKVTVDHCRAFARKSSALLLKACQFEE